MVVGLLTTALKNVTQLNLMVGNTCIDRAISLIFEQSVYNGNRIPDSLF